MKRVLVTGGPVYGPLDSNKLVGNRVRGLWAGKFAEYLMRLGYPVTLLVADTHSRLEGQVVGEHAMLDVVTHRGYWDYAEKCYAMALTHDAAVMAGAVVNWIPAEPIVGKMETKGYEEGAIIQVPFVLAPRVINRMRTLNPKLTLVGCKMLIGSTPEELVDAAYHVSLTAKCNVVVANDMKAGLRTKRLVYPDRTVVDYENDFEGFFEALKAVINDEHWHSEEVSAHNEHILAEGWCAEARATLDRVVEKYRDRFSPRGDGKVFGSLLVPILGRGYLASPREKGTMFSAAEAVWVPKIIEEDREVRVGLGARATMNAPLLVRFAQHVRRARQQGMMYGGKEPIVLHLHEQLPGVPTVPYGPPGTDRDNMRVLPEGAQAFNIEGHGFVACLDPVTLEILR